MTTRMTHPSLEVSHGTRTRPIGRITSNGGWPLIHSYRLSLDWPRNNLGVAVVFNSGTVIGSLTREEIYDDVA
jgi:hypothetical protein